jgi:hypothetical protein
LAEEAANQKPCVCCHCRPVRAWECVKVLIVYIL